MTVLILGPAGLADKFAGDWSRRGVKVLVVRVEDGARGMPVTLLRAVRLIRLRHPEVLLTISGPAGTQWAGRLLGPKRPCWVAHVAAPAHPRTGRWERFLNPFLRALRRADLVTASPAATDALHRSGVAVAGNDPVGLASGGAGDGRTAGLKILMLGTVNTPHVEHLAIAMRNRGHRVVVAGDVTPAYPPSVLPAAGVGVRPLEVPATAWLHRLQRAERPGVIHANWLPSYAFLAALLRLRPLVAMAWGSDVYGATPSQDRRSRFALRRADVAMSDSEHLVGRLVELGADPEATFVLNWGVELDVFCPARDRVAARRRLGFGDGPLVLSPRALRPPYNPDVILDAFEAVVREHCEVQFVLKHIEAGMPELGRPLPPSTRLVGHVSYKQLPDYYRAADICVSVPDTDSSPRSVWEAMACGCACVISDLPWAHELIRDGEHALLVPPEPDAVAGAIRRLLTEPGLAERIGAGARALVERHRDTRIEMDRLARLYASVAR